MVDTLRIEKAIRELLIGIGENPDREGLIETPKRVAQMYNEIFSGVGKDASKEAKLFLEEGYNGMIVVKDIPMYSMCEHHLLPFFGVCSVAYIPDNNTVLGLSKIARIVDTIAKKPQLQERLCDEVAEVIYKVAGAKGVYVMAEAEHLCMTMRGIRKPGAKTVTSATRGVMTDDAALRSEARAMIGENK